MIQVLRRSLAPQLLFLAILVAFTPNHSRAQGSATDSSQAPPVRVQEDSSRRVLNRVAAKYPAVAHNLQIQGIVKVEAVVAPNGKVKAVELKGGHPILVQAAEEAVREWKWEASPRETRELVEIKFVFQ